MKFKELSQFEALLLIAYFHKYKVYPPKRIKKMKGKEKGQRERCIGEVES